MRDGVKKLIDKINLEMEKVADCIKRDEEQDEKLVLSEEKDNQ